MGLPGSEGLTYLDTDATALAVAVLKRDLSALGSGARLDGQAGRV
jgi:hypothetical protein